MEIVSLVVRDADGVEQSWEGTGHVHVRSTSKKGQPYVQAVDAHLVLESVGVIKERDPA